MGRRAAVSCLVAIAGCSKLLGIESLQEGDTTSSASTGLGGAAGDSGSGGGMESVGGSSVGAGGVSTSAAGVGGGLVGNTAGGHGGSSGGMGGSMSGSGGAGTGGTGGVFGSGGFAGTGGTGAQGDPCGRGEGGAAGAEPDTVRGCVVNHWLNPIAGATVMIGATQTETDADGSFEVVGVSPEYDAMLQVSYPHESVTARYGWVYQGLTRRDPTLQVRTGLPTNATSLDASMNNFTRAANRRVAVALGGRYGAWSTTVSGNIFTTVSWSGPNSVSMTPHALAFEVSNGLPSKYLSYDRQAPAVFAQGTPTPVEFQLADEEVASDTISGTVTASTSDDRRNTVSVRSAGNAVFWLINERGSGVPNDFSYLVPGLPNASITVAAHSAQGVAWQGGLSPGDADVSLVIPSPPTLEAPAPVEELSQDTVFRWSGEAKTYLFCLNHGFLFEGICILTSNTEVTLPTFPNGFALSPTRFNDGLRFPDVWRVDVVGDATSVDELTGPEGFASEFSFYGGDRLIGPQRSSGTFVKSLERDVIIP